MSAPFVRSAVFAAAVLLAAAARTPSSQANPLQAPTPVQSGRAPMFENDAVTVWRTTIVPNAPLTMHRHDHPRIIVALQGGLMNFVPSQGPIDVQTWETGKAYWLPSMPPGLLHEDVNAGGKPIEVMVIEMKHEK